jgi:hypothetical protein
MQHKYAKPNLKGLKQIAIDEIYVGKNHYLSVVLDILSGAVVFVGDNKRSDALEPFLAKIAAVLKGKD